MGLHTAACSATSRKVSVHPMNSTFFSLSDYIASGVKKSFWEPSECKKHLIHCRQHTNYMNITNYSLSHHTLLTGGGECLRKASTLHCAFIKQVSSLLASTLVMLRPQMQCKHACVKAGMAYTVGYIVHGPSQLASAV